MDGFFFAFMLIRLKKANAAASIKSQLAVLTRGELLRRLLYDLKRLNSVSYVIRNFVKRIKSLEGKFA